jgi:hypothetical protein
MPAEGAGMTKVTSHGPLVLPKGAPPEMADVIANAIRRDVERHGIAAFAAPREAAIMHEVGHTIVGAHEGFTIRQISIYSRSLPIFGEVWAGQCIEAAATWTQGPDTTVAQDLSRARFIIAGLCGEAITGWEKPGSSKDELAVSQFIAAQAAIKLICKNAGKSIPTELADAEPLTEADHKYMKRLWYEEVYGAAWAILRRNRELFWKIAEQLNQHDRVKGGKLHKMLAEVKKVAPPELLAEAKKLVEAVA